MVYSSRQNDILLLHFSNNSQYKILSEPVYMCITVQLPIPPNSGLCKVGFIWQMQPMQVSNNISHCEDHINEFIFYDQCCC